MKNKFYITTPIYYPNDKLHVGHCYTTILCDVFKKFQKNILKNDCLFVTGSDEHGQKIAKSAKLANMEPKEYVDKIVSSFKNLWDVLNIEYDIFIRTTDPNHIHTVQEVFEKLLSDKYIYLGKYKSNYCESCEEAFSNSELINNACPKCGKKTILINEKSYFLKCSEFKSFIRDIFDKNIIKIQPENKKTEMVNNFINNLHDLSISRTEVKWAIPVRSNPSHTIYVWFDALLNYISALNYQNSNDDLFKKYWSNDCTKIHIIGKEITRFHTIYWPIILKTLNLEFPNKIISHGWIIAEDDKKMSKSLKNCLNPFEIISINNNSDILRYYLAKVTNIGDDFYFSHDHYLKIYNFELANNVGNLISRVCTMIKKYYNGIVPKNILLNDKNIICIISDQEKLIKNYQALMSKMIYKDSIEEILKLVFKCNKLIENYKPWELYKNAKISDLDQLIIILFSSIILSIYLLSPFLPNSYNKFLTFFKIDKTINLELFLDIKNFEGAKVLDIEPLFLRINEKK